MAKLVGYMVTFTTYGSWLQGDRRRYVKRGEILEGNEKIYKFCIKQQKGPTVKLNANEKNVVQRAISEEAQRIGQYVAAITVCTNHVHFAARSCDKSIEQIVSMYKSAATRALRSNDRQGKIWTKSFDKRFCFTEEDFKKKIIYVQKHNV
ncbi:MAG: transposase [Sedimentisphaerales bacterium]|nr:transposase [Sedimentisphaerales bacterium]